MWYTLGMNARLGKTLLGSAVLALLLFLFGLRDPFLPRVFTSGATTVDPTAPVFAVMEDSLGRMSGRLESIESENRQLRDRLEQLTRLSDQLRKRLDEVAALPRLRPLQDYPFPDSVTFCGETVSLDDPIARERFEAEFNRFLVNRHWLITWMRRSRETFPWIEQRLADEKMPDDLKYVAVIESALDPRATSPKGAAGYWQFTRDTGRRFGLRRTRTVDERRDLHEATDAALRYMKELHDEFGSWALVLAAYNSGERRVREAIEEQGQEDFHDLYLPRETEAYWYKAAAVKLFFEHPGEYDIVPPKDDGAPAICDTLVLKLDRNTPIREILGDSGLSYRVFKRYNPAYRRTQLTAGTYRLVLPRPCSERIADKYRRSGTLALAGSTTPSR